jgi:hypothetical protein
MAQLTTFRDGLVTRDQSWYSWEEGLRAAGLDPSDLALDTGERVSSTG